MDEYAAIRKRSVKNAQSDTLTPGKFARDETSYTVRAGNTSYFDLGEEWKQIIDKYDLSDDAMFELFNEPVLKDAIKEGKTIRFSHNPLDYRTGALVEEWEFIKKTMKKGNKDLIQEGGFWYVK